MASDPYVALGVKKTASEAELKAAYRKIAKADHPCRGGSGRQGRHPTIDGPVNLNIPKGATTDQKLRLRGRGVNGGDQQVELKIVMPPKVDPELEAFMESWRKSHDYDPRAGMNRGSRT